MAVLAWTLHLCTVLQAFRSVRCEEIDGLYSHLGASGSLCMGFMCRTLLVARKDSVPIL